MDTNIWIGVKKWGSYGQHKAQCMLGIKEDKVFVWDKQVLSGLVQFDGNTIVRVSDDLDAVIVVRCESSASKHYHEWEVIKGDARIVKKDEYNWIVEAGKCRLLVSRCVINVKVKDYDPHITGKIEGGKLVLSGQTYDYKESIKEQAKLLGLKYRFNSEGKVWEVEGSNEQLVQYIEALSKVVEVRMK